MAVGIVDPLEMVDIEQHERQRLLEPHASIQFERHGTLELPTIPDAGQRIGGPESFEQGVLLQQFIDLCQKFAVAIAVKRQQDEFVDGHGVHIAIFRLTRTRFNANRLPLAIRILEHFDDVLVIERTFVEREIEPMAANKQFALLIEKYARNRQLSDQLAQQSARRA